MLNSKQAQYLLTWSFGSCNESVTRRKLARAPPTSDGATRRTKAGLSMAKASEKGRGSRTSVEATKGYLRQGSPHRPHETWSRLFIMKV